MTVLNRSLIQKGRAAPKERVSIFPLVNGRQNVAGWLGFAVKNGEYIKNHFINKTTKN